jgi:tRNA1Val (adenine37-N6)-methyltransferase
MFKFKQFSVDQTGCAMKINTDGVLLGALTETDNAQTILDIGTGTGVIALMLAQRFTTSTIDAVEIDAAAAKTADKNFENSPFAERLKLFPLSFEDYFDLHPGKQYDLIVSNPPFHLNSLESPQAKKSLAKHTDNDFFGRLIEGIATHLNPTGHCWLVLPLQAAELVKSIANQYKLFSQKVISIHSYNYSEPHRQILVIGNDEIKYKEVKFVIYDKPNYYSEMYSNTLKDFFTIF